MANSEFTTITELYSVADSYSCCTARIKTSSNRRGQRRRIPAE